MKDKLLDEESRGVKLTIIDQADYEDYKRICDAIISLGYKATVVDNGVTVFGKVDK